MKLILFSGDHPRHLFVNKEILGYFDEVLIIIMNREETIPSPPSGISKHDIHLVKKHFKNRYLIESANYGHLNAKEVFQHHETIYVNRDTLNSEKIASRVREFNADFCFIFGVGLILDPVIGELPNDKINLHLGLSPWYKGAATLFWPFYHLEPQFCGSTFHQISKQADAGEIIHQCVPELFKGDTIHDVGARAVIKAKEDLCDIVSFWKKNREFKGMIQTTSGRNWRGIDFHPSQLRVIYDLFDDKIVDNYLLGKLNKRTLKLFSCIK